MNSNRYLSIIKQRLNSNQTGTRNKANRDNWLEQTLANISVGSRILDAGAGELQYKRFCTHLEYVSQDFAQYTGEDSDVGLQKETWDQSQLDIISDITQIPEPDASFEAILCVEVLEHVPYPISALRELSRLLKPQGVLIVTAPFCSLTHYAPYFYQTGYSRYFYEYWLERLGFEIVDMQWNGNYFDYLSQELRRLPYVGKEYTNSSMNWLEHVATKIVLGALSRFSKDDHGSEQLLSYGLHVQAKKQSDYE